MSPHETYCQFLIAIDTKHIDSLFDDCYGADCSDCPARTACDVISGLSAKHACSWTEMVNAYFVNIDQSLPLSHYREHHPEYFL